MLAEVGGPIDETRVTLAVHGADVDPDEISALLGRAPTTCHRAGDPRPSGMPWPSGAWLFSVEDRAPVTPDQLVTKVLDGLPVDTAIWQQLHERFALRLGIALFVTGWTQGLELPSSLLVRIGALGLALEITVYMEAGREE